jgi:hypothetical protein
MRKLAAAVPTLIAVAAGFVCLASSQSMAQEKGGEVRPGCFDLVTATGVGYPLGLYSKHSAIKAWKRQVWATYGRDFDWRDAADREIECAPYKLVIRCMAAARPCS